MNRLKELREERGWTQRQTAMKAGLAVTTYNNYEHGIREPGHETLILLANMFHVSVDYLIGKSKSKISMDDYSQYVRDAIDVQDDDDALLEETNFLYESRDALDLIRACLDLSGEQIHLLALIAKEMTPKGKRPPKKHYAGLIVSEDV